MLDRVPERAEWEGWLAHPISQQLLNKVLAGWEEELKEEWSRGRFTELQQYATAIKNAKAIGSCETINRIRTLNYEFFCAELGYEYEPKQPEATD